MRFGSEDSSRRIRGDRLKQLRAFCHTARVGTISEAARRLKSSQPAVSNQIRALESDLDVRLFERRGPRIALTRSGEHLYRYAMPLVQGMDRLPDFFAEQHFGHVPDALTIGAGQTSGAYLLPRYLKRFRERYPGVRVDLQVGVGSKRLEWLRGHELDLIVLAVDKPPKDLEFFMLAASRFMLITPRDHPLAGRPVKKFADLDGHRFVGPIPGQHGRAIADAVMRQRGVDPDFAVEVDGWSSIKALVASGLGISAVPEVCLNGGDALWSTPLDEFLPLRTYGVLTRNDGLQSLSARRFLDVVSEQGPDDTRYPALPGAP